jgi:LppP/LprE lipoprotein
MTLRRGIPVLLAASCAALLSACGSGTRTVSVANTAPAPTATATATATRTNTSAAATPSSTTTATATASATASARTQSAPAFVQTTTTGVAGPAAIVVAHGYTPASPSTYNPQNTLQVIIAGNRASGRQKAFFFVNGNYIGTDTSLPSGAITLVDESDTEVTLGYALVHPDGSSAGVAQVRYALNNGMLSPLDPIPSASPAAPVSRR